jgi:endonuclease/exonuclease/phosphatase family metal-dependent hydrolase
MRVLQRCAWVAVVAQGIACGGTDGATVSSPPETGRDASAGAPDAGVLVDGSVADEPDAQPTAEAGVDAGPSGGTLRVMTYNIKVASESNLATIAQVIRTENPDLVGLEEVDELANRSGSTHQTDVLSAAAGLPHRYFGANFPFDGGFYGLAVLSRFPLTNPRVIRLDARATRGDGYEPRIAVAVDLVAYGKPVTFVAMHASLHAEERPGNAQAVLTALGSARRPSIVVGDMNETPGNAIGTAFSGAGFIDAHAQKTGNPLEGLTSPASFPIKRIDFVYKDAAFGPTRYSWVPSTTASDHRPVMVTFDTPR